MDPESGRNQDNNIDHDKLEKLMERAKTVIEKDTTTVPPFWNAKYKKEAAKNWDLFYKRNTTKFFKDRHWTDREFTELADRTKQQTCLEVGCGVGNFVFPLISENPSLFMYACDFSKRAVDMVKANEKYDESRCKAFVCDLTQDPLTENVPENSLDMVSAIFVFSAIPPEKMHIAIKNIYNVLKPGGCVLFRDYAIYDEAQVKFSASSDKRLDDNFYVRQDGTMSYFFSKEDLQERFHNEGFETVSCDYVYRETVNRSMEKRIDRIFAQAKFRKI